MSKRDNPPANTQKEVIAEDSFGIINQGVTKLDFEFNEVHYVLDVGVPHFCKSEEERSNLLRFTSSIFPSLNPL